MARKLFRLSLKRSMVDNPDSPENHEALLPGHLFQSFTREIIESAMDLIKGLMVKDYRYRASQGDDEVGSNALGSLGINSFVYAFKVTVYPRYLDLQKKFFRNVLSLGYY